MVQTWWQKLNANERMAATGAIIVFIVSLLGGGWIAVIGSAIVLVVYWLKYSPNQITWPAPVELINLVISGILALFALVGLLALVGMSGLGFGMFGMAGFLGGVYLLVVAAAIAFIIGAGMMVLGTWREYQAMPKTASSTTPSQPTSPPPPPAAPPSTPPSTPSSTPPSTPSSTPPSTPSTPPGEPPSA
jgi:hypothetical protein